MRIAAFCLFAAAATRAFADPASFPDGYWDRQYGFSQQWSVIYSVSLKVQSPPDARAQAIKLLEKAGATPAQGGYFGFSRPGQAAQFAYLIPIERAERAAKSLFDLGDLQQYTNQKIGSADQLPEIRDKISALESELRENSAALEHMPIAKTLETSLLGRLTQARDAAQASAGTALISVALIDAAVSESAADGNSFRAVKRAVKVADQPDADRAAKGALGAIRSALSIYYGDTEGHYPTKLSDLTLGGKYLTMLPKLQVGGHKPSDSVLAITAVSDMTELKKKLKDTGGWAYVSDPHSALWGTVVIDCTHADSSGRVWADY
jgi:hypothetical protein